MSKLAQKLKSLTVLQIGVVLLVAGVLVGFLHFYPEDWSLLKYPPPGQIGFQDNMVFL